MSRSRKTTGVLLCTLGLMLAVLLAPSASHALPACDISWDRGAGTDSWHTAANWTGDVVPASGDDVCLPANGAGAAVVVTSSVTVASVQGDEPLTLSAGTLTLNGADASEVATFNQLGGTLDGSATLRILGTFLWRAGTQTTPNDPTSTPSALVPGSGRTVIAGGATGAIRHSNAGDPAAFNSPKSLQRELEIEPSATLTHQDANAGDSQGYLSLGGTSGFIDNDGTLRLLDDQDIFGDTVRGIDNDGTIVKETGAATSTIGARFDNDGAIDVDTGTLQTSGHAMAAPHSGTFNIVDAARLRMNGGSGHALAGSITRVAGSGADAIFEVAGASVAVTGTDGANLTRIVSGRLDFNANAQSLPAVELLGGALGGDATVTVTDFLWRDGTQDTPVHPTSTPSNQLPGTGRTVIPSGGTIAIRHSNAADPNAFNSPKSLQRELEIEPSATFIHRDANATDGQGYLSLSGTSGFIDNDGTMRLLDDQDIFGDSVRGIDNDGTIVKETGAATSNIDPRFDNDGAIEIDTGTLQTSGPALAAPHSGTFNIGDGARLRMDGGGGHVLSGALAAITGGTGSIFEIAGAAVGVEAPNSVPLTRVVSGRLDFNTNAQTLPAVEQFGGTLGGDAPVTVTNLLWRDGAQDTPNHPTSTPSSQLPGTGRTIIPAGGSMTIAHSNASDPNAFNSPKTLQREIQISSGATGVLRDRNAGDGQGYLSISGVSGLLNVDGDFSIEDDQDIFGSGRGIALDPAATLTKTAGAGNTFLDPSLDLDGLVRIDDGVLRIRGNGQNAHAGTFDVDGGSTLHWEGGTHVVDATSAGIRRTAATAGDAHGRFTGAVTVNAPYELQETTIAGGASSFNHATTTTGPLTLTGGRGDFNTAIDPPSVTHLNGTLGGAGVVTTPSYLWRDGTQDTPNSGTPSSPQPGTGRTVIPSGGSMTMAHSNASDPNAFNSPKSLNREIHISPGATGVLRDRNATNGQGYLSISGTSGLLNVDGDFAIEDDQDILSGGRGVSIDPAATLTKTDGTGESIVQPALDQEGTLVVDTGRMRLDNVTDYDVTNDVLGGGTYVVRGTLALNQGDLDGLAAHLVLDGVGSLVDEAPTGAADDGLDELDHIVAGGELELSNGRTLTTPVAGGPLVSDGTVTVDAGTTLVPTGGLTIGATGLLRGGGVVDGNVTNGGVVAPGSSPGRLTINGDYTQGAGGTLRTEIEGATPATGYDQLAVTGTAALGGTLDIPDTPSRHEPPAGASFDILTAASRTGSFVSVTNAVIDADRQFEPVYEADRVRAVVTTAAEPALAIEDGSTQAEGDSGTTDGELDVTLSEPTRREVTVNYATSDGTATQPGDYAPSSGTLTFAPGEVTKTVEVPVAGDELDEPDETVIVTLSSPAHATLDTTSDDEGTLTIQDDDAPPVVSVRDELLVEEPDTGTVTAALPVRLSAPSGRTVTVDVDSADDTATAGSDYTALDGTVTFNPGETAKTADVAVLGDTTDEGTEHLDVALSAPSQATLDAGASSGRIGIVDNDPAGTGTAPNRTVSIDDVRLNEGDSGQTTARFSVTLDAATTAPVEVAFSTGGGSAGKPGDYADPVGPLSVTFAPGQTERTVGIPVNGDTADESDETFNVTLSVTSGPGTVGDGTGVGTIVDDDEPAPAPVERIVTVPAPPAPAAPPPAQQGAASTNSTTVVGCVRGPKMGHRFFFPRKVKVGKKLITRRSRIELVTVLLDKRRIARLAKAPYRVTVDIAKLRPGKHSLVANARLRVPGSRRTSRKQLRFEFVVCG